MNVMLIKKNLDLYFNILKSEMFYRISDNIFIYIYSNRISKFISRVLEMTEKRHQLNYWLQNFIKTRIRTVYKKLVKYALEHSLQKFIKTRYSIIQVFLRINQILATQFTFTL